MGGSHLKTSHSARDIQVFKRIKSGDYEAFKLLFDCYYSVLCNYSLKFIDEHFIADDIVQEVFIKIWEKRKTIVITSSVKSYLYTAVKNKCLNRLKSEFTRTEYLKHYSAQENIIVDYSEIEQEEFRNFLFQCIEKLPPRCKDVFLQSRFSELKQEMIAKSMNIALKTVKAQIGKALKLLKICLQPNFSEYF